MTHTTILRSAVATWAILAVSTMAGAGEKFPPLDKSAAANIRFREHVWPILKRHCWSCHSGAKPGGGLRMDSVKDVLAGGEQGPLFARGKPDESLLLAMVSGDEPKMPPKPPRLSAAKIHALRQWIFAGAKDGSSPARPAAAVNIPAAYEYAPAVTSVAFSPDGKRLAAACRSEVVVIDVDGDATPQRLQTESDLLTHVEFSPDGKLLAAAGGSPAQFGEVRFFHAADGRLASVRKLGHDTLFRGCFAPDGTAIALGGADGAVHIVPVDAKAKVRRFELHSDWVLDVAYSPDGKMLVSGGRDKATKVSSVETGKLLRSVDSSSQLISSVASDGQFAVSGGRARTLIGYEFKVALTGIQVSGAGNGARPVSRRNQYVKGFETQAGVILDLATSGDRKLLAVAGDGGVRVYRIANRQRVALIAKVPSPVYSVALNADGSRLALGGKSGQVEIYGLPSAKRIKSILPVPLATAARR